MTDNVFSLSVVPKVFEYLEHIEKARPGEHFTNGNQWCGTLINIAQIVQIAWIAKNALIPKQSGKNCAKLQRAFAEKFGLGRKF